MADPKRHTVHPHPSNLHPYHLHTSIMSDKDLFRAFMDFVKNYLPLVTCASKYKVNSRIIKNLLDEYKYHQLSRTRQEKEHLLDTNNHNHITRWSQEQLDFNDINKLYTDCELMTACQIWVLSNAPYDQLKYEYGIPKSTLKLYLEKICPLLQCRNAQHEHQMLRGEVSRSKVL